MRIFRLRTLLWLPPALILILILTHTFWLRALGRFLVRGQEPWKAEMIVVLAGDHYGFRIRKACELAAAGYAPRVLVSGPRCCYDNIESELAIRYAARCGCDTNRLISFPHLALNTRDEAAAVLPELRRLGVRRFIVVTSNYHTRRSGNIFSRLAPAGSFRMVAAPDKYYRPEDWWQDREARKIAFFEWSKTLANWLGE